MCYNIVMKVGKAYGQQRRVTGRLRSSQTEAYWLRKRD